MLLETHVLVLSALLTWLMIMTSSTLRGRMWTPSGLLMAFGNREGTPQESPPLMGRADRAAKNMLENLPLFIAVLAAVHLAHHAGARSTLGANLFFWGRAAYWPLYVMGIPYLRTAMWGVSIAGMAMIGFAAVVG